VEVKTGGKVIIALAGNPSLGYFWEAQDLDSSIFEQIGKPVFVSDSTDMVSSGGTRTLLSQALKTGTANLAIVYHRPRETDVEPIDTFSVSIAVK
jgi:predicted secreted protein